MALLQWHFVDKDEFNAGIKQDAHIYFIKDTAEIYKGDKCFNEAVELYEDNDHLPINPARKRLYINKYTLEGKIYDGTQWMTVILPVSNVIDSENNPNAPINSSAVVEYVTTAIEQNLSTVKVIKTISYQPDDKRLVATHGDNSKTILTLTGLGASLSSSVQDNKNIIQMIDIQGNPVGNPIQLDIERFLTNAEYDSANKKIILYFDGKTSPESEDFIEIPIGDLVDTYTSESTNSIDLTIVDNRIKASIKISEQAGNIIGVNSDGLYVDTSGLIYKLPAGSDAANHIPLFTNDGDLVDSGIILSDIVGSITDLQNSKIDKSAIATTLTVANSSDTASDDRVISEKAFTQFMEWKSGM